MKKINDIETIIDNFPIPGVNILPERFGLETIIQKQEKKATSKSLHTNGKTSNNLEVS